MVDSSENQMELPWVEKYRPKTLAEIASQSMTVQTLQRFIEKDSIPHLIFSGPAGTGKTSTAYSLIYDLLGVKKLLPNVILERNASDNVRMDTRDEIKNFVKHVGMFQPRYKFVILDEADLIPKAMQSVFRRIIEMAPPNVKFIFMCNYVENIIDPILSRCAIFRFYPLPYVPFSAQIDKIIKCEKIRINEEIKETIYIISRGDMRRAINLLQMAVSLNYEGNSPPEIDLLNPDVLYEISGFLPRKAFQNLTKSLLERKLQSMKKILSEHPSFSSRGLFLQILIWIAHQKINPIKKDMMINLIGEFDYRLTLSSDPLIQMDGFLAELIYILEEKYP